MSGINVVLWGLGAMGSGIFELLQEREGLAVTGAIGQNPRKIGQDIGDTLGKKECGVIISGDALSVLTSSNARLVIHSTGSFFRNVYPELIAAVRTGHNVITIAEELAEPWSANRELAENLDSEARKNGVSVIGTGVNPGFVLDTLIIALSGVCCNISRIEAERINDLSPFGRTVMATQGVGLTPEEFEKGVAGGAIVGHIGFAQSINLIAGALGWKLENILEEKEPIISKTAREAPFARVEPGMVAGCNHRAYGIRDGKAVITLKHPQQICPEQEEVKTGDFIRIEGTPAINLSIEPEVPGGTGTIAMAVNMIPAVMAVSPGLKTLLDLSIPHSWDRLGA